MANFKLYAAVAIGVISAPVSATSYSGELYGYMTSGYVHYSGDFDYNNPSNDYISYSFAGLPISINFSVGEYHDPFDGLYVSGNASFSIDMPSYADKRVGTSSNMYVNPYYDENGYIDFSISSNSAYFSVYESSAGFNNDEGEIGFGVGSFSSVLGPMSGSGSLSYTLGWGSDTYGYGSFQITSGRIYGSGIPEVPAVPEPATWAMMLIGFGAVGAVARRRRGNGATRVRESLALA